MHLKQINGQTLDLEQWREHINNSHTYAQVIIEQINSGYYEKILPPINNAMVIDLGANVGLFSLFIAPYCKKIIAVEPTPNYRTYLEEAKKKINAEYIIINAAVAAKEGVLEFFTSQQNSTMNSLIKNQVHNDSIPVTVQTLKQIINKEQVDLLKIDIEGAEESVILSIDRNLSKQISKILVECHENFGVNQESIENHLKSLGYSLKIDKDLIFAEKERAQ
jgi:FkbM family methyltransferase